MTSHPTIRDPRTDHLLTPADAALAIIDHQPVQVGYPVVDAAGGTSPKAHEAGLQRDWDQADTVPGLAEILFAAEGR